MLGNWINLCEPIVDNTLNFGGWRFKSTYVTKVGCSFWTYRMLPLNSKTDSEIYHYLKVKTIFSRKIISERKKNIVMDLCPATFRSLVVQGSAKTPGCWPQLKPLWYYKHKHTHTHTHTQHTLGPVDWYNHIKVYLHHLSCAHSNYLYYSDINNWLNSLISTIDFPMSFLFKNDSLAKAIYLLIRC